MSILPPKSNTKLLKPTMLSARLAGEETVENVEVLTFLTKFSAKAQRYENNETSLVTT